VNVVPIAPNDLIAPAEVAALLYVDPKTVSRWAVAGKIHSIRTPGGHRRFLRSEVLAMMAINEGGLAGQDSVIARAAALPADEPRMLDAPARSDRFAAGVVAEAVTLAARIQAEHSAADLSATTAAIDAAARRTAAAARRAREVRMQAASEAAEAIAANAARTAADIKVRADATARRLAQAALEAAALVAAARRPGFEREDAATALRLAALVQEAAVVAAEESADAAVRVASAVTAAAAVVAVSVSVADVALEGEVANVAARLQFTVTTQAREVAAETDARANEIALVAREAARAVRRPDLEAGTHRSAVSSREVSDSNPTTVRPSWTQ
jgi:excisionase family DNA binding protein